ncbi:MAG: non-heme iron oxygenase ferredoxin subunit [Nitrososphaerales archaeon]|jgi:nitrite reductase/ring-hydroxylating ferredoxin subunit
MRAVGEFVPAIKASELAEGTMLTLDVKGVHLLLARIGDEISALSGTCTHEDADLGLGFIIEERVVCPLHLSQFDLSTGQVLNPPATEPLRRYNLKIEGETVFVEV